MMGGQAGAVSAPFRVLVTNGGNHSPEAWARETANALVSIDRGTTHSRMQAAIELRQKIGDVLSDHFAQIRARSLASELERIASSAVASVFVCAKGSPWEMHFSEPNIRQAMALTVRRNINTAADLALHWE